VTSWEQKLRELVDEAFELRSSELRAAIAEEIVLRWDRHLRANQTTLACLRVLRETNPRSKGGRRRAA
jgi:hypothetical protein